MDDLVGMVVPVKIFRFVVPPPPDSDDLYLMVVVLAFLTVAAVVDVDSYVGSPKVDDGGGNGGRPISFLLVGAISMVYFSWSALFRLRLRVDAKRTFRLLFVVV